MQPHNPFASSVMQARAPALLGPLVAKLAAMDFTRPRQWRQNVRTQDPPHCIRTYPPFPPFITAGTACESGRYNAVWNVASSDCNDCAQGKYSGMPGSSACSSCYPGMYQPSTGGTSCINCPTGSYSVLSYASASCDACPEGRIVDNEILGCDICPASTYAPLASEECISCPPGKYSEAEEQASCAICSSGRYSNLELGATSCIDCAVGKYASATTNGAESDCIICAAGYYAGGTGSSACASSTVSRLRRLPLFLSMGLPEKSGALGLSAARE